MCTAYALAVKYEKSKSCAYEIPPETVKRYHQVIHHAALPPMALQINVVDNKASFFQAQM